MIMEADVKKSDSTGTVSPESPEIPSLGEVGEALETDEEGVEESVATEELIEELLKSIEQEEVDLDEAEIKSSDSDEDDEEGSILDALLEDESREILEAFEDDPDQLMEAVAYGLSESLADQGYEISTEQTYELVSNIVEGYEEETIGEASYEALADTLSEFSEYDALDSEGELAGALISEGESNYSGGEQLGVDFDGEVGYDGSDMESAYADELTQMSEGQKGELDLGVSSNMRHEREQDNNDSFTSFDLEDTLDGFDMDEAISDYGTENIEEDDYFHACGNCGGIHEVDEEMSHNTGGPLISGAEIQAYMEG